MEERYLFKAKRIDNGEWKIGSLIALPTGEYEISNKCNNPPDCDHMWDKVVITHKVDQSTICQCTGLKDKNGNLIWENDIMVAHLDDDYPEDETYIRILWRGSGFYSKEKGSEDMLQINELDQEYFEVIGNIFDNKDIFESEE